MGIEKANNVITSTVKNVVSKSNTLLDGLKYRNQTYLTNANNNSASSSSSSSLTTVMNSNMTTNELFVWSQQQQQQLQHQQQQQQQQPTSSYAIDDTQLIDTSLLMKKKSTPHISTYTLTQHDVNLPETPQTSALSNTNTNNNNNVTIREENINPTADKDGKRFKCRT